MILSLDDIIGNEATKTQIRISYGAARLNNRSLPHMLLTGDPGCHRAGTKILMADGSDQPVETIQVGNFVAGPNGARKVLQLVRGEDEMYMIQPIKGQPFFVNGNHILSLVYSRYHHKRGLVINIRLRDYLKLSPTEQGTLKLYRSGVEHFTGAYDGDLPIEPYFLGLLLGDGSFRSNIGLTTQDTEVVEEVYRQADRLRLNIRVEDSDRCPSYYFSSQNQINYGGKKGTYSANRLLFAVRSLGLWQTDSSTKHIPFIYKTAPLTSRLQLLAGLMDSDGHLNGGTYDYVTKSTKLKDDVLFVARSCGLAAYATPCVKASQNGTTGIYYRIIVSGHIDTIPCRIERKRANPRQQRKNVLRTGFSVDKIASQETYYGFTVDGDHLYLLSDFTVTHNCGKTTTANAVAVLDDSYFSVLSPDGIREGSDLFQVFDKLSKIGYDGTGEIVGLIQPGILFIDEAHRLTLRAQEMLGIAMEEWTLTFTAGRGRKKYTITRRVPRFTLICATTLEGRLSKPFRDRFKKNFVFKPYPLAEALKILRVHANKRKLNINDEAIARIAIRSRGTPRYMVNYLDAVAETMTYLSKDIIEVDLVEAQFQLMGIDTNGLTQTDIIILKSLHDSELPVGIDTLSLQTNQDPLTISQVNEPYLLRLGLIERTKTGRTITEKGTEYLLKQEHVQPNPALDSAWVLSRHSA